LKKEFLGLLGALLVFSGLASGVELRLKWEEGKRYSFVEETSMSMTMAMGGAKMATTSEITQVSHHDVSAHESGKEVSLAFDSMKMAVSMNGQEMMAFDSKAEDGGGQMSAMLKPLLELKASVIYNEKGEVLEVKGLDDLEGMGQLGMGKEELDQMARQSSLLLPGKDVAPGATWSAEISVPLGELSKEPATMVLEMKFEEMIEKDGRKLAKLSMAGKIKKPAEGEGAPPVVMKSKKIEGSMLFDVELGQPVETKMEMELEIGLPEGVPVEEGAPGTMPMKIQSIQKLKSVGEAK